MTKSLQELITFYETLNHSRTLLLNKLKINGYTASQLANDFSIVSEDNNTLTLTHWVARTSDPDDGSLTWKAIFTADEINLAYIRTEWGSGSQSCDYVDTYSFIIKDGKIVKPNHVDQSFSDFNDSHRYEYPISESSQQDMLNELERLIVSSTPMVEAAMAEYEFKIKATPMVHSFFKAVKTDLPSATGKNDSVQSTNKEVEDMMLGYLA